MPGLVETSTQPTMRVLPGRLFNHRNSVPDSALLRFWLEPVKWLRIGLTMAHELPMEILGRFDDTRVLDADIRVQRNGGTDVTLRQDVHEPKDAHAIAVV